MTRDLVSRRTRNDFREFLAGWTLREIQVAFDGADIRCDRAHHPRVEGKRRACVEQYYVTLNFAKPAAVRRLLLAYERVLERAEADSLVAREQETACTLAQLKASLAQDGFTSRDGTISDHLRVLIEAFLAVVERVLPEQFLEQVTGQRVFAKQPGAL